MKTITIYTKEQCPYCVTAKRIFYEYGILQINEIRIDLDEDMRNTMINITGRTSVPQIFIGDHHVGGCDDLIKLQKTGQLKSMLTKD